MKLIIAASLLLLCITTLSDALTCYCTKCVDTDTCEGDHCRVQVVGTQRTLDCVSQALVITCNVSTEFHTSLCCNTSDSCNTDLDPPAEGTVATLATNGPDSQPTLFPPILVPEEGGTTTTAAPGATTISTTTVAAATTMEVSTTIAESTTTMVDTPPLISNPMCFRSSSEKWPGIRLCPLTHTCFSTLRRRIDGSIASWRGCSRGPCEEETRNRKVKRCCNSHMCNIELNPEEFFPDLYTTTTSSTTSTTSTPHTSQPPTTQSTTTTQATPQVTNSPSERPPIRPPILTPLTSTTSTPSTDDDLEQPLHCHCRSTEDDQCMRGVICKPDYSCAKEYSVESGEIQFKPVCVSRQSECGLVAPNLFRSCCAESFCNQQPDFSELPHAFISNRPDTTSPPSTTSTPSTSSEHTLNPITIGAIALSIVAFVLIVVFVVSVTVICYVRCRNKSTTVTVTKAATNPYVEHSTATIDYKGNSYHGFSEEAGRASVQSTASSTPSSSNGKSSLTHLMTSV